MSKNVMNPKNPWSAIKEPRNFLTEIRHKGPNRKWLWVHINLVIKNEPYYIIYNVLYNLYDIFEYMFFDSYLRFSWLFLKCCYKWGEHSTTGFKWLQTSRRKYSDANILSREIVFIYLKLDSHNALYNV